MPDQIRRPLFRRREISFNQGAEWNALISKYIGTIPLSGDVSDIPEQCISAPPPSTAVISAMIVKAGAAARHNHSAAVPAAALRLPARACAATSDIVVLVMAAPPDAGLVPPLGGAIEP